MSTFRQDHRAAESGQRRFSPLLPASWHVKLTADQRRARRDRQTALTTLDHWFGLNPAPDSLAGGPNRDYTWHLAWIREQPPAKAFAEAGDDRGVHGYELTEPAIYYQACYIRLLAPFVTPRSADEP